MPEDVPTPPTGADEPVDTLPEDLDVSALAGEFRRFPFARLVHTTLPEASMRLLEESLTP